ncbi:ABC transporter permease [Paludisphaera mucosa]|uniref:ABC-2 family transporter protein n=1 Tax=Paludisphaera mucosa TaxID=3030827 RepID=A0ABT6F903_9BACT|nr:ABC-2 family transporter protein [Paludisphaera mucosa]MDG3004072.1 ABC-2 family transporter protein [Paludisphaera mucosa]
MKPLDALAPIDGDLDLTASHRPRPGFADSMVKYARIFRVSLIERMTYRSDFLLGTILRFLPIITTILLWRAIYEGSGQAVLGGFNYREMIAYLLLTNISRLFSSMPGLAAGIARDVREGTLKRYLLQPLDLIGFLLSSRVAHKVAYITMSFIPYAGLFYVCRGYFDGFPDALTMAAYAVSLILSFMVGFYFEASVGMVGFWFLEVTSVLYIVMTLNFFVSGHMLPLDLLPQPWSGLLKVLPFQYMAYFPAVVFQGKIRGVELALHLALELFWAVAFLLLAKGLYRAGLRRYSAYGG